MDNKSKNASAKNRNLTRPNLARVKLISVVLLFLICLGLGYLGGWLANRDSTTSPSKATQKQVVVSESHLIRDIASQVGPSVVSVNSSQQAQSVNPFDLFGGGASTQTQESAGTGIIISSNGVIMTNRHVVPAGTTKVSVTTSDGTTFKNVKVIGRTSSKQSLDVAFLQIQDLNGAKLKPAKLGDSSKMHIGDKVVAIGNALGQFHNTVTSGIISGHGRSVQASGSGIDASTENLQDLFQTDAAINEGNSGGPLVNSDGEVIGMNTAVASNSQNIGFAIPVNDLKGLINTVLSTGKFEQPYLGVMYLPLTKAVAEQYNIKQTSGAYILLPSQMGNGQDPVQPHSPAAKAGLKPGDVITRVNGTKIDDSHNLTSLLDQYKVGDKVTLKVVRSDKNITITATLGKAPSSDS